MERVLRRLPYICYVACLTALTPAATAQAQERRGPGAADAGKPASTEEDLDAKAKRLFIAGKYSEAIEILARLYTETNDPIYLRNIGRSYQRLREPDRAIASFEEYLLRGKNLSRTEKNEVRGFIKEMEDMRRRMAGESSRPSESVKPVPSSPPPAPTTAAKPPGPSTTAPAAPVAPLSSPVAAVPPPIEVPGLTTPPPIETSTFSSPPVQAPADAGVTAKPARPIARAVAIAAMGLAGALAAGGLVFMAASWSKYYAADKRCPEAGFIRCEQDRKDADNRKRTSKIMLIGAGVTGAAGVTLYLLNPGGSGQPTGGLALGLRGRF